MQNKIDIERFVKKDKNIVVDLDSVEYLITDESLSAIKRGDNKVPVFQLYDSQVYLIEAREIDKSLSLKGLIDYLDKKN